MKFKQNSNFMFFYCFEFIFLGDIQFDFSYIPCYWNNQLYCSWELSGVVWVVHAVNATLATEVANNVPAIPAVKRDSLLDFFIVDSWDNKKMSIF